MDLGSCFQSKNLGKRLRRMISRNTNDISVDLANWMGNLDDTKRCTSINVLAIPGSHDSMTYGISRRSKIAPDAEPLVKDLAKYLKPFVNFIMYGWSVTQNSSVKKQLNLGVRYLDLRIATKENDPDFYFVHGMYGNIVTSGLKEIEEFLNEHKKEVVILDFQHFYAFNNEDHNSFIELLKSIFVNKLCPRPTDVTSVTLDWMFEHNYQVIAIYRNPISKQNSCLWTSNLWPTPWPNTMNITDLLEYLENNLSKRHQHVGYVSQCVLTPQTSTVVLNPFSGVMNKCAKPVSKVIIPWIQEQKPQINVAIADFIDMNNANFPLSVISLNYL